MQHITVYPTDELVDWIVRKAELSGSDVGEVVLLLAIQGMSVFASVSAEQDALAIAQKQMKVLSQRTGWPSVGVQIEWRIQEQP